MKPVLLGCAGLSLTEKEGSFFARENPFGFILFARNCQSPPQLQELTAALRAAVRRHDAPIFIDQEGGRVARLRPPSWPALPPARKIGLLYERDPAAGLEAVRAQAKIIAGFLREAGIDGNCAPLLDLCVPATSDVMGDRVFSADPAAIIELGRATIQTYLACGIVPVMKHMPGHGRVTLDPHKTLPFVETDRATLEASDFVPFRALAGDAPLGMNAHVVFKALDASAPVSLSPQIHDEILRGSLGFKGMILSDDLAMGALSIPLERRGRAALEAGADIAVYCTGRLEENESFCADLPAMKEETLPRWEKACRTRSSSPWDRREEKTLLALLEQSGLLS